MASMALDRRRKRSRRGRRGRWELTELNWGNEYPNELDGYLPPEDDEEDEDWDDSWDDDEVDDDWEDGELALEGWDGDDLE